MLGGGEEAGELSVAVSHGASCVGQAGFYRVAK